MVSNHFQNAYVRTKEQTESPEHGNYVGEAREKTQDSAKALGNAAIRSVGRAGKEAVQKILAGRFSREDPKTDASTGEAGSGTRKTGGAKGTSSGTGPEKGVGAAKNAAAIMNQQPVPQREPAAFNGTAPLRASTVLFRRFPDRFAAWKRRAQEQSRPQGRRRDAPRKRPVRRQKARSKPLNVPRRP